MKLIVGMLNGIKCRVCNNRRSDQINFSEFEVLTRAT